MIITAVELLDAEGNFIEVGAVGQPVTLRVNARCISSVPDLVLGYMIKDRLGQDVFGTNTYHHNKILKDVVNGKEIQWEFEFGLNVGEGSYSVSLALHANETHVGRNYQWQDRAMVFEVINMGQTGFRGQAWLPPKVRCSI